MFSAANGVEGLKVLGKNVPDLIVSDIKMPLMDGYEFVAAVRARPEWVAVPVIFLTAKDQRADIRLGKQLGADDYLTKPFEDEDLLVAISAKLKRRSEIDAVHADTLMALKRAMLGALNHEFRSPLASIVAYSELIGDSERAVDTDAFSNFMEGLRAGVSRLARLVEDYLLLVSLQTDQARLDYEYRRTHLDYWPGFINPLVETYREQAAERRVTLEVECPSDLPAVEADPVYLSNAVGRLLHNGIKFSSESGGLVRLSIAADEGWLNIRVADDGVGIRKSDLPHVFDLFVQIDRQQREQQGTGIGLTICREIVEMHGGTVSATSQLGRGSTFVIALPLADLAGDPIVADDSGA